MNKDNVLQDLLKNAKITKKDRMKLTIIGGSIKGLTEKRLWDLYGVITTSEKDDCHDIMLRLLDLEMIKRNIKHDFTKDYIHKI